MTYRLSVVLGGAALAVAALVAGGASGAAAAPTPTPTPTYACPPALPVSGIVTASTATSLTISYYMLLSPPCGYDPPATVTLFTSSEDARQWQNPVAEATSGPERNGKVTIDGLTPGTTYWFRFSFSGERDPYAVGSGQTTPVAPCTATAAVGSAWGGGFVATVTVRSAEALDSWRVSWRWPGDQRIVSLWNGVAQGEGADVTVGNASYNGSLAPGGSATFGMLVAGGAPAGDLALTCDR